MVSNLVCSDDGIEHAMSHNSGQSGGGCSVDLHDAQNGPGSTNPKPLVACCIEFSKGLSSAASEGCLGNGRQSRSRTLPCTGCTWAARVPPAGSSSWEATAGSVAAGAGTSGSREGIPSGSVAVNATGLLPWYLEDLKLPASYLRLDDSSCLEVVCLGKQARPKAL